MAEQEQKKHFKYEYDHFDLGYGMHYGVHSVFGEHVAFGERSNMVHIYPYKIFIGDDPDMAIRLTPAQQRVLANVFKIVKRRIDMAGALPEHESGEMSEDIKNGDT